jgi:hypothetical protein
LLLAATARQNPKEVDGAQVLMFLSAAVLGLELTTLPTEQIVLTEKFAY